MKCVHLAPQFYLTAATTSDASVRFFPPPSPRARLLHAARLHAADRLLRATEPPWRALLAQATLPWS